MQKGRGRKAMVKIFVSFLIISNCLDYFLTNGINFTFRGKSEETDILREQVTPSTLIRHLFFYTLKNKKSGSVILFYFISRIYIGCRGAVVKGVEHITSYLLFNI